MKYQALCLLIYRDDHMKYSNAENKHLFFFFFLKKRISQLLIVFITSLALTSPTLAFVSSPSAITSAKDIQFTLANHSPPKVSYSDFSMALQSRILNLLTQQLLENTDKKFRTSFLESRILYKTNTFAVNIISNFDNRIRIEIHEHGISLPKVVEVSH